MPPSSEFTASMPPVSRTTTHDGARVAAAYETALNFPFMTALGNLNNSPELMQWVVLAAGDLTLRRRLISWQQATGCAPPPCNTSYELAVPSAGEQSAHRSR